MLDSLNFFSFLQAKMRKQPWQRVPLPGSLPIPCGLIISSILCPHSYLYLTTSYAGVKLLLYEGGRIDLDEVSLQVSRATLHPLRYVVLEVATVVLHHGAH